MNDSILEELNKGFLDLILFGEVWFEINNNEIRCLDLYEVNIETK